MWKCWARARMFVQVIDILLFRSCQGTQRGLQGSWSQNCFDLHSCWWLWGSQIQEARHCKWIIYLFISNIYISFYYRLWPSKLVLHSSMLTLVTNSESGSDSASTTLRESQERWEEPLLLLSEPTERRLKLSAMSSTTLRRKDSESETSSMC